MIFNANTRYLQQGYEQNPSLRFSKSQFQKEVDDRLRQQNKNALWKMPPMFVFLASFQTFFF